MIEVPAAVAPSAAVRSTMMPVLFVLLQLAVSVRSSPDSLQSFTKRYVSKRLSILSNASHRERESLHNICKSLSLLCNCMGLIRSIACLLDCCSRLTDHDRTKWNRQLQKEETKHALWSTFQEQETSRHGRGLLARQLDEDLGYMLCDGVRTNCIMFQLFVHETRRRVQDTFGRASFSFSGWLAPNVIFCSFVRSSLANAILFFLGTNQALTQCLEHSKCLDCFAKMSEQDIDWATMPDNLECRDVLNVIYDKGHCNAMAVDKKAESAFCVSFQACVKPQHEKQQQHPAMANATTLDCSSLVRCEWPGMHEQFLGDGICHENLYGCYNSAVCGWDKGDCCPDSCHEDNNQIHCGMEGYACRDPLSRDCNNALSVDCGENKDWVNNNDDEIYAGGGDSIEFACPKIDEEPYRLTMYDSFGDGWEETKLILTNKDTKKQVFEGGLKNGAQGTAFVCLSAKPACYTVTTKGGIWGKEVSWELKPYRTVGAAPAIASGGAPMTCEFAAYGTSCDTTCNGRTTEDPTKDSDYTEFKAMFECVTKKCPIQVKSCQSDEMCDACLEKEDFTPTYCFGMDSFNAVVDCALCACTDDSKTDYCMSREGSSGGKASSNNNQASDGNSEYAICSPTQTMAGSDAILEFSQCTKFDEVSMLLMDFDQNHFGDLDTFEKCAHEYRDRVNHGGHTAQECMSILNRAKDGQSSVQVEDPGLAESIQALARIVYEDGENFCDCATQANKDCPLCSSFLNFKTLLYESVDACNALDKIDCAAWNEFYTPCRSNLIKKFTNADLSQSKQCDFVLKEDCGGAGTFPSFRRLDCEANLEVTHGTLRYPRFSLADSVLVVNHFLTRF